MTTSEPPTIATDHPVVLFDGTCGMCDALVRRIIRHDPAGRYRFAPLQSETGRGLLAAHPRLAGDLDSVVLIDGDKAYAKSTAVLLIAVQLEGLFPLAGVLGYVPLSTRDDAYDWIARHRKQWFKKESCPAMTPEERGRFIG